MFIQRHDEPSQAGNQENHKPGLEWQWSGVEQRVHAGKVRDCGLAQDLQEHSCHKPVVAEGLDAPDRPDHRAAAEDVEDLEHNEEVQRRSPGFGKTGAPSQFSLEDPPGSAQQESGDEHDPDGQLPREKRLAGVPGRPGH